MTDDHLTAEELEELERTPIGARAAAEIRQARRTEPGPIALSIGFFLVVAIGLGALAIAPKRPTACPAAAAAPP